MGELVVPAIGVIDLWMGGAGQVSLLRRLKREEGVDDLRERWPASSKQRFALDKWNLCRLVS